MSGWTVALLAAPAAAAYHANDLIGSPVAALVVWASVYGVKRLVDRKRA